MGRIAVVGSGIAGLSAGWLLARRHDVVLFEREPRPGGHTHTHHLETPDGALALDTGFLVHNDRTYPRLVRLLAELGVGRADSDMSFGVTDPRTGFEYSTRDVNGLFADRRNLVRPGHYRLLLDILRFNRASRALAEAPDAGTLTLGEFLDQHRLRGEVLDRFLFPLAAAIWSAPTASIRSFPALTLVRFFDNHGMNTAFDHPTWKTIPGGCATYIPRLLDTAPRLTLETGTRVTSVRREADGVRLGIAGRPDLVADEIVLACHGDDVLPLLADPSPAEREVFGAFETSENQAWLHTDAAWLPRRPAARAAWNYRLGDEAGAATVTYHLNRLQGLRTATDYCVTLNPDAPIAPSRVLRQMTYRHPRYTRAAIAAQARWAEVSGVRRTHYAGAYWFYGFHEDGLRSGVRVANALGVPW
ncbi:MAG: FAD-dependent oxidoreductase [Vicinamibacterales bacterium]